MITFISKYQYKAGVFILYNHHMEELWDYLTSYFEKEVGSSQQDKIRKSYKKVKETIGKNLDKWCLCIPIKIKLYDGDDMQELLDDNSEIKAKYFKSLSLSNEQIHKIEVIEDTYYKDKKLFKV